MHEIELHRQDLNLLVVLRTLLETGSVSEAGRRLGLSPSATSHALGRLRDAMGDPLLVRDGNRMLPTPYAEAIRADLERVLDDARLLYREQPAFSPESTQREFTVSASDLLAPALPEFVAGLAADAPGIGVSLVPEIGLAEMGALGTGQVDVALKALPDPAAGLRADELGSVSFVVVARRGHPFIADPTLEQWLATPHVAVGTGRPGAGFVGEALAAAGHTRRVSLRVTSFLLALHAVAETTLLFTAPAPIVEPLADTLGLQIAALPLPVPRVPVAAVWHERFEGDPGHAWFRTRIAALLAPCFHPPEG